MIKLNGNVTDDLKMFGDKDVFELLKTYGSPLYFYNESILRKNCRELKNMVSYENFSVHFSAKANSNLSLLKIVREEGLDIEAVSMGEIYLEQLAGFTNENIFFVFNNVSDEEMLYAIERGITLSVDSISQLERFGRLVNSCGKKTKLSIRFNPGVGAGHHEKVVTAGKATKFGVNQEYIGDVKNILNKYGLSLSGINQHIGSLFMDGSDYMKSVSNLMSIAENFETLEFIDLGGGFGIPYRKQQGEKRLDLNALGKNLTDFMNEFANRYGRKIKFMVEPGRYVPAESCVLLGTVYAVKNNGDTKYIGTDLGMNVLARPTLYDSHHDIEVYAQQERNAKTETVTVVGNICESGDIIAKNRALPEVFEGDILGVLDAGSYGFAMGSIYNSRPRPAEVLLRENGECVVIRERESLEDLMRGMRNDL